MFNPTETQVIPQANLLNVLALFFGVGAPFHLPDLHLFTNDFNPDVNTVLTDLTEANFTGYANVVGLAWGTPYFDADGNALVTAPSHEFVSTGSAVGNVIYGWYLTDHPATILLAAFRLDTPVGIANTRDGLTVVPWLRYSGQ